MVGRVRPHLKALERAIFFETPEWEELASGSGASRDDVLAALDELDFDDPINIQYTSGTTGFPKGATLTHHNILNNGCFVGELLGYTEADRVCIPVPLYHCFGMVLGNLAATHARGLHRLPGRGVRARGDTRACAQERCTSLYGVPTMFIAELGHAKFGDYDLGSLRTGIMAGSPCPVEVMKRVSSDMGIDEMAIAFGMTETSPVTTQVRRDDTLENRCGTVGQVLPHTEIKIVDPDTGRTVPRGEPGRVPGPRLLVMRGYWNDPERTDEAIDAGGLDAHRRPGDDGRPWLCARRRPDQGHGDPRRREHLPARDRGVSLHPPTDRRRTGDRRARRALRRGADGLGRPAPGAALTEDEVKEFCRGQVAHYKVPRYVKFVDSFPMTVTGKVQKFKMRETAIDELGLGDAATVATA